MKKIARIDQMGRKVLVPVRALRIVSLVPSQTELLVDLGLSDRLVGITKFCVHPENLRREKTVIGGTKKVNFEKIRALQPDLIIGNKEENNQSDIEALEKEFPVWMSDIFHLEDSLQFIAMIGEVLAVPVEPMITQIKANFQALEAAIPVESTPPRVVYLIWNNPTMLAGQHTFIDDMLRRLGWQNNSPKPRYPEVEPSEWDNPDYILLSSEPYPFKEEHCIKFREQFPGAKVLLVDGEYFSWYGSRLLKAPAYFQLVLEELAND